MSIHLEVSHAERPGRPAVVAPPHPLYGGRMDNPVVMTLAHALSACGYAPLRFNWRGVGSSSGAPSGKLDDALEDYRSALATTRSKASGGTSAETARARVLAAGYSFGAIAALAFALDEEQVVERLVLVAPPVSMLRSLDISSCERDVHVVVGERDTLARTEDLAALLRRSPRARLDVIADADHFFAASFWLEKLAAIVSAPHA